MTEPVSAAAAVTAVGIAAVGLAAGIDHVVAALLEGLLSLLGNRLGTVAQGTGQSLRQFGRAAAVLAELIVDLGSGDFTNLRIAVVEGVDQSGHDFRRAIAVVLVADLLDGLAPLTRVAGGLRLIDQFGQTAALTRAEVAGAAFVAATVGIATVAACRTRWGSIRRFRVQQRLLPRLFSRIASQFGVFELQQPAASQQPPASQLPAPAPLLQQPLPPASQQAPLALASQQTLLPQPELQPRPLTRSAMTARCRSNCRSRGASGTSAAVDRYRRWGSRV